MRSFLAANVKRSNLIRWDNMCHLSENDRSHWPTCNATTICFFNSLFTLHTSMQYIYIRCGTFSCSPLAECVHTTFIKSSNFLRIVFIDSLLSGFSSFFEVFSLFNCVKRVSQIQSVYYMSYNWRLKNQFVDFYRYFCFVHNHLFKSSLSKVWTVNHTKRVNINSIGCSCFCVSS